MNRSTRPGRNRQRGVARPASGADQPPRQPQPRDVLVQRTTGIEPTYALHVLDTLPPNAPPAITCHGLHQAIHQADALARAQAVDIWYTEDVSYFVRLIRYRGALGRTGSPDASLFL